MNGDNDNDYNLKDSINTHNSRKIDAWWFTMNLHIKALL